MTVLGTDQDMDAQASDRAVWGLVSRLERDGHHLTPRVVERIHDLITSCIPDNRLDGGQAEAAKAIKERIDRDDK